MKLDSIKPTIQSYNSLYLSGKIPGKCQSFDTLPKTKGHQQFRRRRR